MPYDGNSELPKPVRNVLPAKAQSIWRNAFNSAEEEGYGESRCAQIAWGAVKNAGYEKNEDTGKWVKG